MDIQNNYYIWEFSKIYLFDFLDIKSIFLIVIVNQKEKFNCQKYRLIK